MFSLAKGFYLQYTRKDEYYVLLLGIDNAGKTTLLEKIKTVYLGVQGLPPDKITPTVGLNIATIQHFTGKARINFWDLGGQTDLQSIWKSYYAECHAIVFMVDSCDSQRIEDVQMVFDRMISNDEVEGVPVIMLANKQDMDNALPVAQIKEIFNNIAQKLDARDSRVMPVSALTGEGVNEAVEWLWMRLDRNKAMRPPISRN